MTTPTTARKRSGARVLAEMLDTYGLTHFFMVPAILRRTMKELEEHTGVVRIHAHGEKAAAYMADGYARAANRPGLCGAQVVGALNLAAGLRDAWLAHAPVIALTGGRDPRTKYRNVYQEVDDVPAFEPVTKFNATVDDVSRVPDMVRQAFRAATTGCPGPVHLQFRGNEGQLDVEETTMEPLAEPRFSSVPPFRPSPEEDDVAKLLDQLRAARRPVMVAGGGVRASGAAAELVAVAEALDVPVATSLNGKDVIPAAHPLSVGVVGTYARGSANRVVSRADVVCFVGSSAGGMTTNSWSFPASGTTVLQIDIDPAALGRHYPLAAAVHGDARVALRQLLGQYERRSSDAAPGADRSAWLAEVGDICRDWRDRHTSVLTSEDAPTRPERMCAELSRLMPDDGVVVVDTGHAGMWMGGFYDVGSPRQRYLRSCGHLGWAFPAGLGAKCALPERPVVVFTGDAGLWYHIAEIETAVRWGINSVTVVNNNSGGNQSKRGFDRAYGDHGEGRSRELWTFSDVDFSAIAEQVGALGLRVEKPAELAPAIERALTVDRPAVVDVRTDCEVLATLAPT